MHIYTLSTFPQFLYLSFVGILICFGVFDEPILHTHIKYVHILIRWHGTIRTYYLPIYHPPTYLPTLYGKTTEPWTEREGGTLSTDPSYFLLLPHPPSSSPSPLLHLHLSWQSTDFEYFCNGLISYYPSSACFSHSLSVCWVCRLFLFVIPSIQNSSWFEIFWIDFVLILPVCSSLESTLCTHTHTYTSIYTHAPTPNTRIRDPPPS
ncbi:hypothetical protein EJ05DRAFT_252307 [Pseudovirgaria hyperparasitica]|uniref:Uncharacterized protein n=1 Tax=Pseudovirgaria hyperparasitica TaxID=470096 RepID=A0A6A6WG91_9PEZI|nr:uncharacterized protein EJ05DRAFT_252307 [Pseudovirgaria hyperparasitica]KAF2761084.1 hypothetical protein EJ05DRAFT_252307 [Pseudovirgaria hyperparasitica]